jgi:hypothetical protein
MMLERLAEWYLNRRGRVVLPRIFVGLVFGNAVATETEPGVWHVVLDINAPNKYYAMHYSVIRRYREQVKP